jgi:hypothetical protein
MFKCLINIFYQGHTYLTYILNNYINNDTDSEYSNNDINSETTYLCEQENEYMLYSFLEIFEQDFEQEWNTQWKNIPIYIQIKKDILESYKSDFNTNKTIICFAIEKIDNIIESFYNNTYKGGLHKINFVLYLFRKKMLQEILQETNN